MTINELLQLNKAVRERLNGLKTLRSEVSTRTEYRYGVDDKKTIEPQYDVKRVDQKVTELETWLFKSECAIKQANATTHVDIKADVDTLLAPLQ